MSQTHDLSTDGDVLVKRYASWDRDEHRREWMVLNHLHPRLPDLVPAPLAARLDAVPPSVKMSRLPGLPLAGPLTPQLLDGLAEALRRMWSVPAAGLPPRRFHPAEAVAAARSMFATALRPEGVAGEAFDGAAGFLRRPVRVDAVPAVVGHGDPNLANYLWDGTRVRIVDLEDAGASDVAYELATMVEHLSARDTDWTAFVRGFDVDGDRLRWSRTLFATLWFYWLLPGNGAAKRNPPGTLQLQAERLLALLS
ncbi:aminoglycoside phosphotransferase family protein [Catellatospora sp. NPDC049609]|uniref:phosphotransferase family protein n=1 Tax=Catellatospora sp. NPDC049609 TaxID=3155505 RepID=UPI0034308EAA